MQVVLAGAVSLHHLLDVFIPAKAETFKYGANFSVSVTQFFATRDLFGNRLLRLFTHSEGLFSLSVSRGDCLRLEGALFLRDEPQCVSQARCNRGGALNMWGPERYRLARLLERRGVSLDCFPKPAPVDSQLGGLVASSCEMRHQSL